MNSRQQRMEKKNSKNHPRLLLEKTKEWYSTRTLQQTNEKSQKMEIFGENENEKKMVVANLCRSHVNLFLFYSLKFWNFWKRENIILTFFFATGDDSN